MGQSEIKREHLRLTEEDFPILENKTKEIMRVILSEMKSEPLQIDIWPYRYLVEKNTIKYELIFSQMGSVTLRIAQSERYRRNPPPIFYISIGKYENAVYVWEDFNASEVNTSGNELVRSMESAMAIYENSIEDL
jgi:hypothetical protein